MKTQQYHISPTQNNMIYNVINHAINKSKPLEAFLQPLLSALINQSDNNNHKSLLLYDNMNNQQMIAQIQHKLKKHMRNIKKSIKNQSIQQQPDNLSITQKQYQQNEYIQQEENQNQIQGFQQQPQEEYDQQQQNNQDSNDYAQPIQQDPQQYNQQEQQQQQQQQMINQQQNQHQYDQDQDDVGLYGQQLDQQDMQSYQNQLDKEGLDPQFQRIVHQLDNKKKIENKKNYDQHDADYNQNQLLLQQEIDDKMDDAIEDHFDQFRQIQLQKQQQQPLNKHQQNKSQLDIKIDQLQNKIHQKKQWTFQGQVKARQRPLNSLLEYDLQFKSGLKFNHDVTIEMNNDLQSLIKQRILDQLFDDRVRYTSSNALRQHFGSIRDVTIDTEKSKKGLAELYQLQFKNYLGIGENKHDRLKKQIMDQFKQLNYKLDCLSNFNFIPKPVIDKGYSSKGNKDTIVIEEKVPITMWNGQSQESLKNKGISQKFISQKQVDNQGKRLKNKRIARQRKKQQMKKRMNRKIQYGGMTKYQAQAKKKILKNRQNATANIKYNKSASFFKSMNQKGSAKPNPNINKMKI